MGDPRSLPPGLERRREIALAGHRGDVATARAALTDVDGRVRATALGALARAGALTVDDLARGAGDPEAVVRRRVAEAAAAADPPGAIATVQALLDDDDASVVEAAAWACGELTLDGAADGGADADADAGRADDARHGVVDRLSHLAVEHEDALVREAAVAALGSIGDERGLAAILAAASDKPAVRRRAVLALAPFEGADVDAALTRALTDRDWQVRQAAEDLSEPDG
ncbi:MAG TPA: HEAT repeat domain-containing protein [Acidimicrobiales bacterium]|jgi:HEAT repeat protein